MVTLGRWVAGAVAAVLTGACGGPAADLTPSTTVPLTVATTTSAGTTTTPFRSTSTTLPAADVPDLLVAHPGGINQVGAGIDWYRRGPVAVAIPDLRGGVVFQRDPPEAVPIEQLAGPGADPAILVERSGDDRLTALDAFLLDGKPTLAYTRTTRLPNDCPADDVECLWGFDVTYLQFLDMATGSSTIVGVVGSFESDGNVFRFAADGYVSVWTPYGELESCVGFGPVSDLLGDFSQDGTLSARDRCRIDPPDDCTDEVLCRGGTRVAPAPAGTFAYTGGGFSAPLEVRVVAADTGDTVRRALIGEAATQTPRTEFEVTWLEFDGDWILIGRRSLLGSVLPTLVVRPDGTVEQLEFAGRARFWMAR